jgi:hypothetical protein
MEHPEGVIVVDTGELSGQGFGPFPASWPLTQAGDMLLVPTEGHTHGHRSVVVRQPGSRRCSWPGTPPTGRT